MANLAAFHFVSFGIHGRPGMPAEVPEEVVWGSARGRDLGSAGGSVPGECPRNSISVVSEETCPKNI